MNLKKIVVGVFSFFLLFTVGNAKEINLYFYVNGGKIKEENFEVNDYYKFIQYNGESYAEYTGNTTIKNINSIKGKTFTLTKDNTSLVKGREWYLKNVYDDKIYYFSESNTYKTSDIFKQLSFDSDEFMSLDLYANWSSNPKKGGVDITPVEKTTSGSTETGHTVTIKLNANGGTLKDPHGNKFSLPKKKSFIQYNGSTTIYKLKSTETLGKNGLYNPDSEKSINLYLKDHRILNGKEWNTKADGSGKSYSDSALYQASDFCDASDANCTVTLYANWVEDDVHFEAESYTLRFNQTKQLKLLLEDNTRVKKNITWTSSKPAVAKVDENGKVVALKAGETVIKAKRKSGAEATIAIKVIGDAKLAEVSLKGALKFCEEGQVRSDGSCNQWVYKLSHGVQSIDATNDGKYMFFLSPDTTSSNLDNYGKVPIILRIYKKYKDGYYRFYKKATHLNFGHANGVTYYQSSDGGHQLLVATSLEEGTGPMLVRYRLYLSEDVSGAGAVKEEINSITFYNSKLEDKDFRGKLSTLESSHQTVVGVASNVNENGQINGLYVSAKQPSTSINKSSFRVINYYNKGTSTLSNGPAKVFRRSGVEPMPKEDVYFGAHYHNQDLTYHNGTMYMVYYDYSPGCIKSFETNYGLTDCKIYTNFIGVYNADGSFKYMRTLSESTIAQMVQSIDSSNYDSSNIDRRIKEAESVFFMNGESYIAVQKSLTDIVGTYIFKVSNL